MTVRFAAGANLCSSTAVPCMDILKASLSSLHIFLYFLICSLFIFYSWYSCRFEGSCQFKIVPAFTFQQIRCAMVPNADFIFMVLLCVINCTHRIMRCFLFLFLQFFNDMQSRKRI